MRSAHTLGEFYIQAFAITTVWELILLLMVGGEPRRATFTLNWNGRYTLRIASKVLRSAIMLFYFVGTRLSQVAGPIMILLALMHLLFKLL